jgi:hypothetical protein
VVKKKPPLDVDKTKAAIADFVSHEFFGLDEDEQETEDRRR